MKKSYKNWSICFIALGVLFLCIYIFFYRLTENDKAIIKMIGKKINFPKELQVKTNSVDTTQNAILLSQCAKLVIFYDSLKCSTCEVGRLESWDYMIEYASKLNNKFKLVFIINPKSKEVNDIKWILKHKNFDYPILLDTAGYFAQANKEVIENQPYNIFLLNKSDNIVLVGDPTNNNELRQLYLKTINDITTN